MKARIQTITAVTALVVAVLGATPIGHAATSMILPRNSVGTTQLRADAVTAAKIRNGTLTAAEFKAGALPAGPKGEKGDKGDRGDTGPQGPAGPAGLGKVVFRAAVASATGGTYRNAEVSCNPGEVATGGGIWGNNVYLVASFPNGSGSVPDSWHVRVFNPAATESYTAYVVCAAVA